GREGDLGPPPQIVDFGAATGGARGPGQPLAALEQKRAARVRAAGEVFQRHQQIEAGLKLLDEELARRAAEIGAASEQLASEKKSEPVLFGKDDWRARRASPGDHVARTRARHTAPTTGV